MKKSIISFLFLLLLLPLSAYAAGPVGSWIAWFPYDKGQLGEAVRLMPDGKAVYLLTYVEQDTAVVCSTEIQTRISVKASAPAVWGVAEGQLIVRVAPDADVNISGGMESAGAPIVVEALLRRNITPLAEQTAEQLGLQVRGATVAYLYGTAPDGRDALARAADTGIIYTRVE